MSITQLPLILASYITALYLTNWAVDIRAVLLPKLHILFELCQFSHLHSLLFQDPIQDLTLYLFVMSPQSPSVCDSSSIFFLFFMSGLLRKTNELLVILQNAPQLGFVGYFLMIRVRLCMQSWQEGDIEFSLHHIREFVMKQYVLLPVDCVCHISLQ